MKDFGTTGAAVHLPMLYSRVMEEMVLKRKN